jgi:enamine deaminase RidA (YjgF/YER057c/UK114 family)
MAGITRISSGAPWEPTFGYSRAVKAGGWLLVSGTTSFDENGRILGRNQMYTQARQAIANISAALERAGMTLADVVRTRVFVTDLGRFAEVARAHLEAFGDNPPASTIVEIQRLVNPDMMIEIEADAFRALEVKAEVGAVAKSRPATKSKLGTKSKSSKPNL